MLRNKASTQLAENKHKLGFCKQSTKAEFHKLEGVSAKAHARTALSANDPEITRTKEMQTKK